VRTKKGQPGQPVWHLFHGPRRSLHFFAQAREDFDQRAIEHPFGVANKCRLRGHCRRWRGRLAHRLACVNLWLLGRLLADMPAASSIFTDVSSSLSGAAVGQLHQYRADRLALQEMVLVILERDRQEDQTSPGGEKPISST